jgi:hypothetical protein
MYFELTVSQHQQTHHHPPRALRLNIHRRRQNQLSHLSLTHPLPLSHIIRLNHLNPPNPPSQKDGIILADNILRRGLIADSSSAHPWSTKQNGERNWEEEDKAALDQFNKALVNSERCDTFLMPMFDGLGCGRLVG